MNREDPIHSLRDRRALRLGIMGGAFDPIHIAHMVIANEALVRFNLDRVVFMPAGNHPFKGRHPAPAEFRYHLVELATASNPGFSVSRLELDKDEVTYTCDTLGYLAEILSDDAQLFFIAGADAVLDLASWKAPEKVLQYSTLIAASRTGFETAKIDQIVKSLGDSLRGAPALAGRVVTMEVPALGVSSTMIRGRVAEGLPIRYLVPDAVAQPILDSGHYRDLATPPDHAGHVS